jgi:hypothetical protein
MLRDGRLRSSFVFSQLASSSKSKAICASKRRRELEITIECPAERVKHSITAIASFPGHGIDVGSQTTVKAGQALRDVSKDSIRTVWAVAVCWNVGRMLNSLCKTFATSLTDLLTPTPNRIEKYRE